jgi:hypothetical protein
VNDVKRHEESDDVFGKTKKIWKNFDNKNGFGIKRNRKCAKAA